MNSIDGERDHDKLAQEKERRKKKEYATRKNSFNVDEESPTSPEVDKDDREAQKKRKEHQTKEKR